MKAGGCDWELRTNRNLRTD